METPTSSGSLVDSSTELHCVGKLEVVRPKPLGFLCGTIPVPTDRTILPAFNSALVPTNQKSGAPRYKELPPSTDLNTLPFVTSFSDKVLPLKATHSNGPEGSPFPGEGISSDIKRKCEVLAVSGLVDYGDEIDVIAPTDILKQIFKMPYSKSGLSITVHRVGQTLILNGGPDIDGEKFVRRHTTQTNAADHSLFLNFAMHSVRMEACDCPPTHQKSTDAHSDGHILLREGASQVVKQSHSPVRENVSSNSSYATVQQDGLWVDCKTANNNKDHSYVTKSSHGIEQPRKSMQESEKHNDRFMRVFLWQFHNFRMLLGSDMLIFSNDKYVAVSLHLWDITHEVSPLTWLEAWLDNVMANVPELAICYHKSGVVHRYELLKTDEILREAVSDDGFPVFNPYIVQQNGLSVLRFLQENCKRDPGAYWLYKNAGEDVIQLFDFSTLPNTCSEDSDSSGCSLPSLFYRGRSDSLLSLGTLLYRIARRLSHSMVRDNQIKCAAFFKQCLELLNEPDYLVIRAFAHEQFARLLLNPNEQLGLTCKAVPGEYDVTVPVESWSSSNCGNESLTCNYSNAEIWMNHGSACNEQLNSLISECDFDSGVNISDLNKTECARTSDNLVGLSSAVPSSTPLFKTLSDSVASKLAAVHHVSQAIKSLRWMRHLQHGESVSDDMECSADVEPCLLDSSVCSCGDVDCIEICYIWEWLPKSKFDLKLWKLVLLFGESYLALGQAYKDDGQLHKALKVVDLACSLYGSMPSHYGDARFISSLTGNSGSIKMNNRKQILRMQDEKNEFLDGTGMIDLDHCLFNFLFWTKVWTLVGDIYVEFHFSLGKESLLETEESHSSEELRLSVEIVKEVQRLKNKLSAYSQNCTSCSLANCSCRSDRASSGSSASSSSKDPISVGRGKKYVKQSCGRNIYNPALGLADDLAVENKLQSIGSYNSKVTDLVPDNIVDKSVIRYTVNDQVRTETPSDVEQHDLDGVNVVSSKGSQQSKNKGIFTYLRNVVNGDTNYYLTSALNCYKEARKALGEDLTFSFDIESLLKKIGWVSNELGRRLLQKRQLVQAEAAFADAVSVFKEVSDYPNIILIYCNLGHGRRALAEEMVMNIEKLRPHATFSSTLNQCLETAKQEYSESIRYYGTAKLQLNAIKEEDDSVVSSLKNEVHTQYAHTYLKLGMLLAREGVSAKIYESLSAEDAFVFKFTNSGANERVRTIEVTANDAIREAVSIYESLGDLRKQEAAYAYFQLACYQRDCCMKFLESHGTLLSKWEQFNIQRVKQYVSLAERNWQKAIEFYSPATHPTMYLSILVEKSSLLIRVSSILHTNTTLEAALSCMLEGRHVDESSQSDMAEVQSKFWNQLQALLKKMVRVMQLTKSTSLANATLCSKSVDSGKLRELYKMSLKDNAMAQLHAMHTLWTSSDNRNAV